MGKFAARDWIGFQGYFWGYPEVLVAVMLRSVWNLPPGERTDNYVGRSNLGTRCGPSSEWIERVAEEHEDERRMGCT